MEKKKDIFVEGEHINNLFSEDLSPFLKRGSLWIFIMGVAFIVMTYVVKWPEVVKSPAVLTTIPNPYIIMPKVQGRLTALYGHNAEHVKKGQLLGVLETAASHKDILLLENIINQVDTLYQYRIEAISNITIPYARLSQLGEVQPAYERFLKSFNALKFVLSDYYLAGKLELLEQRRSSLEALNSNLLTQKKSLSEDYDLSVARYEKEKALLEKGSTTAYEVKDYESVMLNKRYAVDNLKSSIIMNESQRQEIMDQKIQLTQNIEAQKNDFIEGYKNLKFALDQWKSDYLLISPADGVLSLSALVQPGNIISPHDPVAYVLPENAKPVVLINLQQFNMSAIDTTKKVRIRLISYPHEDYGVLEGRIGYISNISKEGAYESVVNLSHGLTTSQGRKIGFINGLEGEAEVVLKEESLLKKLFNKFRHKPEPKKEKGANPE